MASKAKTVADFKAAHDPNVIIPNRIKAAFALMLKEGPEQWDYEADFVKRSGLSQTQVGLFREQFMAHIIEAQGTKGRAGRRVWVADSKVAKRLRGE